MPKLSATPKMFTLSIEEGPTAIPLLVIEAASAAEATQFLRKQCLRVATASEAFSLGAIGVPRVFAKPEYTNDVMQQELPLGQEVAHGQ